MSSPKKIPRDPQTRKRPGRYQLASLLVPDDWEPAEPDSVPPEFLGGSVIRRGLSLADAMRVADEYNLGRPVNSRWVVAIVGPKPVRGSEGRDGATGAT